MDFTCTKKRAQLKRTVNIPLTMASNEYTKILRKQMGCWICMNYTAESLNQSVSKPKLVNSPDSGYINRYKS